MQERIKQQVNIVFSPITVFGFGLVIVCMFVLKGMLSFIPITWVVGLESVSVMDDTYSLTRTVPRIDLESRSRQNLICADNGRFLGWRNTDYFGMTRIEKT